MLSTSECKRATAFTILILLIAAPCLCQLQQVPFDSLLFDPFNGHTQNYQANVCDSYVAKNMATWKIYTTQLCRTNTNIGIMKSEIDPITDDVTWKFKMSLPAPGQYQALITTDNLIAGLTSDWELAVLDLTTDIQRFTVSITKPADLSSYKLTSTDKYFIIFYQTVTGDFVSEYILPISKTNGAKLWTQGMRYISPYYRNSGSGIGDTKMVMDYTGNKLFVAWEWSVNGAVSIKRKIIGSALTNVGTEEFVVESLSNNYVYRLEGLGIVNGNEFVVYTVVNSGNRILTMWRKNLNYAPPLITTSYIGTNPSLPYYKGAYVVDTLGGQKIVLVYSQVTANGANVMYKVFNDNGSSASTSGNPVVISQSDIKVNGVVYQDSTLYMTLGPVSGVWYLGYINFIHA